MDTQKTIQSVMALMLSGHKLPLEVFTDLMIYFTSGTATDVEIAGFLKVFTQHHPLETEYVIAILHILRSQMKEVNLPPNLSDAVDCCGTGGDGLNSLNISTAVAFFLADYGIPVAKHGNRSITSQSGSADILEYLGYPIQKTPENIIKQLKQTNLSFMFAPYFHPALGYVAQARKALGIRTIFNFLGPLLNPASVTRQVIGVYDFKLAEIMAQTLISFGTKRAIIVTSSDNADELTLSGDNHICFVDNNKYWFKTLNAKDVGLNNAPISAIAGGDVAFNAQAFQSVLRGEHSAYYDTVILNAAAGLWVSGKTQTILEGVNLLKNRHHEIDLNKYLRF